MNKDTTLHNMIYNSYWKIRGYRQLIPYCSRIQERNHYENLILNEMDKLLMDLEDFTKEEYKGMDTRDLQAPNQREFTLEELAQYDGSGGKPAYVAVNGIVYDLSRSPTWGGGTHFGLYSGKDLTSQFQGCHPGAAGILEGLPKVGVIKE